MPTMHAVTFATGGWKPHEFWKFQKTWRNDKHHEILSITFFEERPDFVANLTEIDALREQSQEAIEPFRGEITEIRREVIDDVPMLRQIIKLPRLDHGHGYIYIGTYAIPFQEYSYVIKVECLETGATGLRESAALSELVRDGKLDIKDIEGKVRTNQIPPQIRQMVSQATDHPKFDAQFPDHPLSRLRKHLVILRDSIELDESLKSAEPFKV